MAVLVAAVALASLPAAARVPRAADTTAAREPPYPHGKFRGDCSECHGDQGWKPARISRAFDHAKRSGFALTGAHAALACTACHASLDFTQQRTLCASCHADPHLGELGTDCARCHTSRDFLDHAGMARMHQLTRFPLTGAHAGLDCESCHPSAAQGHLRFTATDADCYSCHRTEFAATTSPPHVADAFPTTCATCHTATAWQPARFRHTGDPNCYGCHKADYDRATNPAHAASGFPTTCATCHNTNAWQPATFDHAATPFALTGAHLHTLCTDCHGANPWVAQLPTDCYACHKAAYDATTAPAHAAATIPTTCTTCHSTTAWQPATFDHNSTPFPLTGAHVARACTDCHGVPWVNVLPTDCYSCHKAAYDATTAPPHGSGGLATTCTTCHNTTAWQPATFDHNTTPFPLTGAHVGLACTACHGLPWVNALPTDCYSCHAADYNATNNPAHAAAGFPTTCATCHTTSTWSGATFNHTWFPITSGAHAVPCADCHVVSTDYSQFSCTTGCHAKATTDGQHGGVSGYVYDSAHCYSCHPSGGGG